MPPLDIFGRPAATRRLIICTGPCCDKSGDASALLLELRAKLIEARLDEQMVGQGSCVRRACLGKCTGEPLAYVDPDGVWYHRLTSENLVKILQDHVLNLRPVEKLILAEDE
jgi:(2Fe-2S) ferredoxin